MIYFAYGSLVHQDRLRELCPTARPLRVAAILDHRLYFSGRSEVWGGGTATIKLSPGQRVWGGLYEIGESDRAEIERARSIDGYVWASTPVVDADGALLRAALLVKVRDLTRTDPSPAYLEVLRSGWSGWGLDAEALLGEARRQGGARRA